jgi:hypothetical protein
MVAIACAAGADPLPCAHGCDRSHRGQYSKGAGQRKHRREKYGRDPERHPHHRREQDAARRGGARGGGGGHAHFGENYLQEAEEKISACSDLDLCWHFIGPLQSNKTRPIAAAFDWVHSVDREKLLQRLSEQRPMRTCRR